jgi:glycerol uptake facilitator-like aquaporin
VSGIKDLRDSVQIQTTQQRSGVARMIAAALAAAFSGAILVYALGALPAIELPTLTVPPYIAAQSAGAAPAAPQISVSTSPDGPRQGPRPR